MAIHVSHWLYSEDLPADCIADCSSSGDVSEAVEYWHKRLEFTVDRERARGYLLATGGWEPEELAASDDDTLARRVLWLACCDFREEQAGCGVFALEG